LSMWEEGSALVEQVLGIDLAAGERPQIVVPAGWWQSARSLGERTLVGCTVAPGFEFSAFELAEPGWQPKQP
ncbi:MAG: cupin, partial [Mesorhizobium sp.]|uniref:cupin domain-containing protein n=1 Tax=Mesorhizobium sp. TaxID=1871066 RepID=UPI000FE9B667